MGAVELYAAFLTGLVVGHLFTKYLGRAEGLAPLAPRTSRTRVEPLPATKTLSSEPPDLDLVREQEDIAERARAQGLSPEVAKLFAAEVVQKGRTVMGRISKPRTQRTA